MSLSEQNCNPAASGGVFASTHWSVVLAAGDAARPDAHAALTRLCQQYWPPLYAFVRRSGHKPEDACDLTQEFFARLLQNGALQAVDPALGPVPLVSAGPRVFRFESTRL